MMVESTELLPFIASDYPEASRRALEELYGAFQLAPWCGAI